MRLALDMNLSTEWVDFLAQRGHSASHWTDLGDVEADDEQIVEWCRDHEAVLVSHDLDFGRILAMTRARGPSVVQFRNQPMLPEDAGEAFVEMLEVCQQALRDGAIVTFDGAEWRARILPLS